MDDSTLGVWFGIRPEAVVTGDDEEMGGALSRAWFVTIIDVMRTANSVTTCRYK